MADDRDKQTAFHQLALARVIPGRMDNNLRQADRQRKVDPVRGMADCRQTDGSCPRPRRQRCRRRSAKARHALLHDIKSGAAVERKEGLPFEHSLRPVPAIGATLATSGTVVTGVCSSTESGLCEWRPWRRPGGACANLEK